MDEGMLHGVIELPLITGPGILEKSFRDIGGYRLNRFLEFDDNTSVACNTFSVQVHNHRRVSSFRKCLYKLAKGKIRPFSIRRA
jgi:hypothetical protein